MEPKVSIVIPTYKRSGDFLKRAIESAINQTYKNIELIVVDDNAPDSMFRKEIEIFMKNYEGEERIVYIKNRRNLGGALARNEGIANCKGTYITFLDDDDEYLSEKVEKQLKFMLDKGCDMSFTDLKLVNEQKIVVDYREYHNLTSFENMALLKYHLMRHLTGTPTFMYRAEKLKEIGGFEDAKVGQEFYLMLKSIERNLNIRYFADCDVVAYRHNSGGISQGENKIIGEKALYEFKKRYFSILTNREKLYIRFRHHAVMTIAFKRNNNYFRALLSGITMLLVSPIDFLFEITKFLTKIYKYRTLES